MASRSAADRRAGYAAGVIAAGAAFMVDAEHLGALDDAEVLSTGQDDAPAVCTPCEMRRLGFGGLADRLEFARNCDTRS
jgi:hypothetical protein